MFLIPNESKKIGFGFYLLGSLVVILINFLGQIPLVVAIFNSEGTPDPDNPMAVLNGISANYRLFLLLLPFAIGVAGLWLVVRKLHERPMQSIISVRERMDWNRVGFAFLLWAAVVVLFFGLEYSLHPENYAWNFNPIPFLGMLIIALLMIPLQTTLEELLFRGYLMQGFGKIIAKPWFAWIMTSLIFGSLHIYNPEISKMGYGLLVFYIGTGLFWGLITLMDQGNELAIGFHAANNLVAAILVTADWTAFQTNSLFIDISDPELSLSSFGELFFFYPILFLFLQRKYKWPSISSVLFPR